MSKDIANCIVDLLDQDNNDLEKIYYRFNNDWKCILQRELKHCVKNYLRSNSTSMALRISKYLDIIKIDGKLANMNDKIYSFDDIPKDIPKDTECSNIILHQDGTPNAIIFSPHLQLLIDYCRSLNLNVYCSNWNGIIEIYVSWAHWKK